MISLSHVSKRLRRHARPTSLKASVTKALRRHREDDNWEVLSDISAEIGRGERVGIVGNNGAGKTTLLKLIAGIFAPDSGVIAVQSSRILALLELGVGFYPDLTGRENVRLNWVFNGIPLAELRGQFDNIVAFSGIEKFLDTPLKYYSSGMRSRLGFSIAAHARPEVLIVDEVLAVGDAAFQEQCYERIAQLCDSGVTLLFVSHNPDEVKRMCGRALLLDQGRVAFDGEPAEAVRLHLRSIR